MPDGGMILHVQCSVLLKANPVAVALQLALQFRSPMIMITSKLG